MTADLRTLKRYAVAITISAAISFCGLPADAQGEFSYAEAGKPYAGITIRVLDEVTPLQEALTKIIPRFTEETGIRVEYELLNHSEVVNRGQADMLSGRGYYDAIMLHGLQLGLLLDADVIRPIDDFVQNSSLSNPDLDTADFIQSPYQTLCFFGGKQYGFLNWNYHYVYWTRADLMKSEIERKNFRAKYGYDLAPAQTLEQMRDIAEFFTRKRGEELKGQPLEGDFYGIVIEGIKAQPTAALFISSVLHNFGGDIIDADGKPSFNTPVVVDALRYWAELWKFAPPGTAEYSLIDVPTVMGSGIAAQSLANADFVMGVDRPGASSLHGQFLYGGPPVKEGVDARHRSTASEPSMIVISKFSKHPEATFLFLQWLVEKRQQKELLEAGNGGVPIRVSSWDHLHAMAERNPTLVSAMKASLEVSRSKPPMPAYIEITDALAGILQQVGLGSLTPEEAAAQGQEAMEELCAGSCLLAKK